MKVIGFAGFSGSGKTTLIEAVIPHLVRLGLRVSLVKHAHHEFDIDQPGKDSYRHRIAGASQVLVSSRVRWALVNELRGAPEPSLQEQLVRLDPCDLVIVEGYKHEPIAKIEVHRAGIPAPWLFASDANIIAIATNENVVTHLPRFDLNDTADIANFIADFIAAPNAMANKRTNVS